MEYLFPVLRLVHIVSGIVWVGGTVVLSAFVMPTAKRLGPDASRFMQSLAGQSGLPIVLNLAGWFTLIGGFAMFPFTSGHFDGAWMRSATGITFSLGALLGTVAAIFGAAWQGPAAKGLADLANAIAAQGAPPTPEQVAAMGRLQGRLARGGVIASELLLAAAACMAVARYV